MLKVQKWLDRLSSKINFESFAGSGMKDDKILQVVNGKFDLVKVGQSDLYSLIQSHKDSVDIYKLLERYQSGDVSALSKVAGQFIDITDAPKTLAEAYTFVGNASQFFDKLPLKLREEYDHDPSKFIADLGSDHCSSLLKDVFKTDVAEDSKSSVPEGRLPFDDFTSESEVVSDEKR